MPHCKGDGRECSSCSCSGYVTCRCVCCAKGRCDGAEKKRKFEEAWKNPDWKNYACGKSCDFKFGICCKNCGHDRIAHK